MVPVIRPMPAVFISVVGWAPERFAVEDRESEGDGFGAHAVNPGADVAVPNRR